MKIDQKQDTYEKVIENILLYISVGIIFYVPYIWICDYCYSKGLINLEDYNKLTLGRNLYIYIKIFSVHINISEIVAFVLSFLYLKVKWKEEKKKILIWVFIYIIMCFVCYKELYSYITH